MKREKKHSFLFFRSSILYTLRGIVKHTVILHLVYLSFGFSFSFESLLIMQNKNNNKRGKGKNPFINLNMLNNRPENLCNVHIYNFFFCLFFTLCGISNNFFRFFLFFLDKCAFWQFISFDGWKEKNKQLMKKICMTRCLLIAFFVIFQHYIKRYHIRFCFFWNRYMERKNSECHSIAFRSSVDNEWEEKKYVTCFIFVVHMNNV